MAELIQVTATYLTIEREAIKVMGPVRDESWRGDCPNGHENTWKTLRKVVASSEWCEDCNDLHEWHVTRCCDCDEPMQGVVKDVGYIGGPTSFRARGRLSQLVMVGTEVEVVTTLGRWPGTVAKVEWLSTSGAFIEIVGSVPEAKQ